MANRRMINKSVIDSDAFLDMPQTSQNLYFHLNMRADDDGFLDNPKKVMRTIGANQNDLELLLAKRYLMAFESGVVVIKHWKLHNSIRKDRYKPTLYQEELRSLIEKNNGVYTDNIKTLQDIEIDQWQPNDNQMATVGTHRLGKGSIVKDNLGYKEKKEKTPSSQNPFADYQPQNTPSSKIDNSVKHWNNKAGLPKTRKLLVNLGEQARPLIESVKLYNEAEILKAIDNYHTITTSQGEYKPIAKYGDIFGFLRNGIEKYWDESEPFENMRIGSTPVQSITQDQEDKNMETLKEIFGK